MNRCGTLDLRSSAKILQRTLTSITGSIVWLRKAILDATPAVVSSGATHLSSLSDRLPGKVVAGQLGISAGFRRAQHQLQAAAYITIRA
jgi:hypothetical protein